MPTGRLGARDAAGAERYAAAPISGGCLAPLASGATPGPAWGKIAA